MPEIGNPNNLFSVRGQSFMPQQPELQLTQPLLANMEAIANPSEVLLRKQTDKILELASQFKTDDLNYELAKKSQGEIENFKQEVMDMYKGNKGMSRLTLTPQQKLEVQRKQKDLLERISWGKQATGYYNQGQKLMADALQKGTITQDEFNQWEQGVTKQFTDPNTDLGSVANPYLSSVALLGNKGYSSQEVYNLERGVFDALVQGAKDSPTGAINPATGKYETRKYLDPTLIKQQAGIVWDSDNKLRKYYEANGFDKNAYMEAKAKEYKVNSDIDKPPTTNVHINVGAGGNGQDIIESEKGYNRTAPTKTDEEGNIVSQGALIPDGTNRWRISAYNIPYTGEAYEMDQSTGKPTKNRVTVKGATRSELVQDYKLGRNYTIVTAVEGTGADKTEKQYIVYNADDTKQKMRSLANPKVPVELKGWQSDFGKNKPTQGKYVVNGVEYTKDELGWTDDQIQKAISAGKITEK